MPSALKTVQGFFPKVATVTDATRPLHIQVTDKDAASKGTKKHDSCAMAVACKRKWHLDGVIISRSMAYLVKGKHARRFMLPPSVTKEIISFDRGGGFAPGNYTLKAVQESAKLLGKRRGAETKARGKDGAPKRFRHLTANVRTPLGQRQ